MPYRQPTICATPPHVVFIFLFCLMGVTLSQAQSRQVLGRVTDASTGEAIPFANVVVDDTEQGTITNVDGDYQLSVRDGADSLHVSFVGYLPRAVAIDNQSEISVSLTPAVIDLEELVFYAPENPAFALLKRVQQQRSVHDKRSLQSYHYESYIKTEVSLSPVSERVKNSVIRKALKAARRNRLPGDTAHQADIPLIMTETLSRAYYQNNPEVKREDIIKSKIAGIGLSSNSWLSQLTASSLQQYNFYENWVKIIGKDFISPVAASGRIFYDYYLSDSLYIDEKYCYQLDFVPKNEQDLAFEGTVWVTQETAALKKIDVHINKEANINYIRSVHIEQELAPVETGAWMPVKNRTLIISEAFGDYPGLRVKSYVSNQDIKINQAQPLGFYATNITIDEAAYQSDTSYWQAHRHDTLSAEDQQTFAIIDTLNQVPSIKRLSKLVDTFSSSHYDMGLIELGPIPYTYAHNAMEGNRFRLGFKTSPRFSSRWTFRQYLAYGTLDRRFKYGVEADYIWRRSPWTQLSLYHADDLSQLGWFPESEKEVKFFEAAALWGDLSTGYRYRRSSIGLFRQLPKGIGPEISLRREHFEPLFDFTYPLDTEGGVRDTSRFTTTELRLSVQFARDEQFIQRDNRRISMGARRWPIFRVQYSLGLNNVLGSDFSYQKLKLTISQDLNVGVLGTSKYILEGGYIFSQLPYPLLEVHLGNSSPFYYRQGFNTMNRAEFISDHYAALRYTHHFEGFFLNRVPLLRKLEWRLIASTNVLYGGVRDENKAYQMIDEQQVPAFGFIQDRQPFVEVGYGIENIFHLIRLEAYHRLSYLDRPDVSKFTIKVGFQIKF